MLEAVVQVARNSAQFDKAVFFLCKKQWNTYITGTKRAYCTCSLVSDCGIFQNYQHK